MYGVFFVGIGAGRTSSLIKESLETYKGVPMRIYPLFFTLFCVPAFSLLLQWCRLERECVLTPFHLQLDSFSAVARSAETDLRQKKLANKWPIFPKKTFLREILKEELNYNSKQPNRFSVVLTLIAGFQATNECSEHPAFVRNNGEGSEVAENGVFKSAGGSDNVCSRATAFCLGEGGCHLIFVRISSRTPE
ncbi:hypothetical protein POTOM_021497 [Populus tomentosa]|uniref:Uncharacterized protein n=1 Tax=Populus tomentosa TaxID=118781 RepID=A0A8X7ZTY5_POPTO|nr:hypothetical protein POTOM_021497 [Populus tomentosa]